jgi:hypothetical protein
LKINLTTKECFEVSVNGYAWWAAANVVFAKKAAPLLSFNFKSIINGRKEMKRQKHRLPLLHQSKLRYLPLIEHA